MTPYIFFIVFLSVMGALNFYTYRRFFLRLSFNLRRFGIFVCFTLFFLQLLFVIEVASGQLLIPSLLFHVISASVGITFLLFVITLVYDILTVTAHPIPVDESRRRFFKIAFDVTMVIAAVAYMLRGIAGGLRRPDLNHVPIRIKDFPFEMLRMAQLSDMHIGRTIGKEFVRECVERINAEKPDMVVITGDLVDLEIPRIAKSLEPLRELKSRFGTFFILGNHEYFHDVSAVVEYVKTLGITVLMNESRIIGDGEERFNLVGINDLVSKRMGELPYDIEAAFASCDEELCTVVLAHQPKTTELTQHKSYDLMLSGHTHGGQIFPFGLLVMIDQPYLAGHYRIDDHKQIYVSRGTGYWGPPLRILAPSEISLLEVRPA